MTGALTMRVIMTETFGLGLVVGSTTRFSCSGSIHARIEGGHALDPSRIANNTPHEVPEEFAVQDAPESRPYGI